jgi:hypothetical protein
MTTLTAEQVMKILELTDSFNLHREAVVIPLGTTNDGDVVALPDQRLRITVPRNQPFDEWLMELRRKLAKMDLSAIRH